MPGPKCVGCIPASRTPGWAPAPPTALSGLPSALYSHGRHLISLFQYPVTPRAAPLHSAAQYLLSERVDPLLQVCGLRLDDTGVLDDGITGAAQDSLLSEFTDHGKLKDRRYGDSLGRGLCLISQK